MAKCDICDKEGVTFVQTFNPESKIDPITLCRTCQAKLLLSLPPKRSATPDEIRKAINALYERTQEEKKNKHKRKW